MLQSFGEHQRLESHLSSPSLSPLLTLISIMTTSERTVWEIIFFWETIWEINLHGRLMVRDLYKRVLVGEVLWDILFLAAGDFICDIFIRGIES